MISGFEQQTEREAAYNKYLSYCTGEPENVFEILYNTLSIDFKTTKEVLGEYFFDKYIRALRDNLDNIEKEINFYEGLLFSEGDDLHGYYTHFKPLLEKRISELILPQQPGAVKFETPVNQHPKFDPNLWNNDCFELFKYLYDCYYKSTNRQLTNIWFYLKENGNSKYNLKVTKDEYRDFMLNNYQKNITNFDKAGRKYEDKEYNTINDHRINFEDSLK